MSNALFLAGLATGLLAFGGVLVVYALVYAVGEWERARDHRYARGDRR